MSLSSDLERLLTLWHQEMGFLDTKCSPNAFLSELRTIGTWGDLHGTQQTHLFTIQNNVLFTASSSQGINHKTPHSSCKLSIMQVFFFSFFCHGIEDLLCLVLRRRMCLCEVLCGVFSKVTCSFGRFISSSSQTARCT